MTPTQRAKIEKLAVDFARALIEAVEVTHGEKGVFSSLSPPPRITRRTFNKLCRLGKVPGARKEGKHWVCTERQWYAAREGKKPKPAKSVSEAEIADKALGNLRLLRARPGS